MKKFILTTLIFIVFLTGCHGCSYIQEKFLKKQPQQSSDEGQQEQERKAKPIPVNPQHS